MKGEAPGEVILSMPTRYWDVRWTMGLLLSIAMMRGLKIWQRLVRKNLKTHFLEYAEWRDILERVSPSWESSWSQVRYGMIIEQIFRFAYWSLQWTWKLEIIHWRNIIIVGKRRSGSTRESIEQGQLHQRNEWTQEMYNYLQGVQTSQKMKQFRMVRFWVHKFRRNTTAGMD